MEIFNKKLKDDDTIIFAKESDSGLTAKSNQNGKFKLLIIDDEKEIHILTKLVLSDYCYKGSVLDFYSAYSGEDAKRLIKDHPDAACVLLDVVMETKDAGLEVARFIREDEKNHKIRIILRTGQPGKAPEKEIILNYDINDYKEKTELTTQKLFTTITTALRSYLHLVDLDEKKNEIVAKNIRLNEEIARRVVAESNLTKYNRSLEKMIDSKSIRLKTALFELKTKETQLQEANKQATVGNMSASTLASFDLSGETIKENLDIINQYRIEMTVLLEKYETLQNIIFSNLTASKEGSNHTHEVAADIDTYKKEINLTAILKRYPEIIKDSTNGIEHILNAVTDIKRFISINDEERRKTNINALLFAMSNEFKSQFGSGIELQTDFGKIPDVSITIKNMEKAFYEIIKNATQAVKSHGIVSISTTFEAPTIIIQIGDIGHGISQKNLQHIFKPYFTTKSNGEKGLGLSFAKSVITNNNGTINITSTLNEGTNVTVTLLASEEPICD